MSRAGSDPARQQLVAETLRNASTAQKKRRLPPFLDHFNGRDLKIFFRCWVGAWVACLLIFINPSLQNIGTAAFFACLVQLMLPPSGIVLIYLLGALSLFLGICLAWAWGLIVMKAAMAARPAADRQARLQSLQQLAAAQANATGIAPGAAAQRLVYDGHMLDARVSAVTFCMVCTFIYFMARLRASNPKLAFTQIFSTIISDLFLNYVPLLPSFSGTMPLALVKPAGIGVGLGLACSILFFPRSTSHVVLDSMEDIVELLKTPLVLTSLALDKDEEELDLKQLQKTRSSIIGLYQKMEPALAFLPLDFSVGCWGARDVETFQEPMRQAMASILSLLELHMNRIYGDVRSADALKRHEERKSMQNEDEKRPHQIGGHQLSQLGEMLDGFRYPDSQPLHDEMVKELLGTGTEAIAACLEGLDVVKSCIHMVNCRRWFWRPSAAEREELYQRSQAALESLRETHVSFVHETTEFLHAEYGPFLDDISAMPPEEKVGRFRGLMVGMAFEDQMSKVLERTEALLTQISKVFHDSPHTRLWFPTGLQNAFSWAAGKGDKAPAMEQTTDNDPDDVSDLTKAAQEKLRISRKYRGKQRSRIGRAILGTYHWFTSNDGLYAMRMVAVTIALAIPGVLPHTAGFYYREKGLWALIMAQTGMLVYMADFTFSVISRVVGTVVGGALGLLAWYIGSGVGTGNPYGLSAIVGAMLIIFMWVRLYLPPSLLQGGIMGGATFLLIVAYSYNDTHIPQYGSPGLGYTVFWRRLLLVLIGVAAATIVQIIPHPPSASKHIRKSLSNTIRTISDHYALLLSSWGPHQQHQTHTEGQLLAEPISLQLAESLVTLDGPIQLLRFEFSSSRFDSASLDRVKRLCHNLNRNLGRLLLLSGSLPQEHRDRLARQTGLLDHRAIGEVMAVLGVCEQALQSEDAPPEILPSPLVRRSFEYWRLHPEEVGALRAERVRDENERRYCVALSAYLKFLGTIDELVLVIKEVLGEAHLVSKDLVALV